MGLHNLIANGGKVLVVGGTMNPSWDRYRDNPQVVFWCGDQSEIRRHMRNGVNIADNTRALIVSKFISHTESTRLIEEAKRKRIAILGVAINDGEITRMLDEITTKPEPAPVDAPTPGEVTKPIPVSSEHRARGAVMDFVQKHHQVNLHNAAEGQRLFDLAQQQGLPTTESSLEQAVSVYRKKLGIKVNRPGYKAREGSTPSTAPVANVTPAKATRKAKGNDEDYLIKLLDDLEATVAIVREEVVKFRNSRDEYTKLKASIAALIKD